jgi:hypothetical protein
MNCWNWNLIENITFYYRWVKNSPDVRGIEENFVPLTSLTNPHPHHQKAFFILRFAFCRRPPPPLPPRPPSTDRSIKIKTFNPNRQKLKLAKCIVLDFGF